MFDFKKISTKELENVKADMCDNFCKLPEQHEPEEWEENKESYCKNCPLDRL